MGFWKNLGIFNFLTSKDPNEKMMSLYLVASEEEKERANQSSGLANKVPFDAETFINITSDRLVTFRVENKEYLTKEELDTINEYLDKLHTCSHDDVPSVRYDAEHYLSYLEKKVKNNK